jgi:uncharacterized protein (TIGR03118 family)
MTLRIAVAAVTLSLTLASVPVAADEGSASLREVAVTAPSAKAGIVYNEDATGFVIPAHGPALFMVAGDDGTISGWSGVGTELFVVVDNSAGGAVYKGLAIGSSAATSIGDRIYAANFRAGTVDVYDSNFTFVPGGFVDPTLPQGYAPFGIQNLDGTIYVTYAKQDLERHDHVPGKGHGFVDAFDTAGNLIRRVASNGELDSPWGLVLAPHNFGALSDTLLVSNLGDGRVHPFNPAPSTSR